MKKLILIAITLFVVLAQMPVLAVADVESDVKIIRKIFQDTNNDAKSFKKIEKDLEGFSAEGGSLTGYLKDGKVQKMIVTYFGEMGKKVIEMYANQENLVFVFCVESSYDKAFGKVVSTEENRLYFKDSTLIRWIGADKKEKDLKAAESITAGKDYLNDFENFLTGLNKPEKMISAPKSGN